ncbi:eosinophil peroxidase-like [Solea senegalensis]|uniref:Eosinophil peroxidase-like n=1 Tax=Solea senegalensis TaxID=28829 RepID=A0AAV6S5H5_SOLSE|nr:eosinophil peroxidase-like [Solea senegalensis]
MSREHNRLVHALAKLNPHWKGERLYHEARKIMGAYFQILTFRDYLPLIVGSDMFNKLLSTYPGYDENVDPSIANVFATAAFRFGHTTFQPFMFRLDEEYKEHKDYPSPPLHKSLFTPWRIIFEGGVDPVLRGLVGRQAKLNSQDHMMSDEMREKLFKFSSKLAQDLSSLNMQRGRDHGLPAGHPSSAYHQAQQVFWGTLGLQGSAAEGGRSEPPRFGQSSERNEEAGLRLSAITLCLPAPELTELARLARSSRSSTRHRRHFTHREARPWIRDFDVIENLGGETFHSTVV